ncbi:MAG: M48 family metallopeptidase [Woeseiaceae bacterium]
MRRLSILVSLTVTALAVVACASSPTGRGQMIFKSDEALAREFDRVWVEYKAAHSLSTDRATIDYVHCVATAVVDALPDEYRDQDWQMAIFDDDEVQAFAGPGGKIGVHTGLLKAAHNQDQLAAVIGHEIGHVTSRHQNEDISRAAMSGVGIQVAAVLLGGGHSGATYTAYEALQAGAVLGVNLPFSRAQETEADVVGIEYMARAGFDPRETVPLWQNMQKEAGEKAPPEFLSTHPSSDTRIESLISEWAEVLPIYNEAKANGRNPNCSM